jgi:hypothetical protein|tara:strand:- start:5302 stop:6711 length:1410 start_codon:yes stop_codon:yes gene_type:complete
MHTSFKQFLVEEEKTVYFTFGRMNPPTIGHGKVLETLAKKAGKNPYRVFLSQSTDSKKNPLPYADKVKAVRKMFPRHARSIMLNKKIRNAMEAASALYDEGYKNVVMVVGSDRLNEFGTLLKKYNGKDARHGFYNFKNINVVSAGERDPDSEGAAGMSATKMRDAAKENDFTAFSQGLPKTVSNPDAKKMFNAVRNGMGLKEENEFKRHIQLETVSEIREAFVRGELFEVGQEVIIEKTDQVGEIEIIGSNYVIVNVNGERTRQWPESVQVVEYKYDYGTDKSVKHMKKKTPGQNEGKARDRLVKMVDKASGRTMADRQRDAAKATANRKRAERDLAKFRSGMKEDDERKKSSPQDADIKDRPGTQPKAYHSGLSKAQKISRDRQFKRQSKMDDDNPAAYKPAAGDKTAKTKPSKHTKKFKDMYGEENSAEKLAKMRIQRQKEVNARKYDRMMDRARTKDTNKKNRETK